MKVRSRSLSTIVALVLILMLGFETMEGGGMIRLPTVTEPL
jgi:hypothetical protein